jgi:hypothetical protein
MVAVTSPAAGGRKNEVAFTPAEADANRELEKEPASGAGKNKAASWASSDSLGFAGVPSLAVGTLSDVLAGADVFLAVYLSLGEADATDAIGAINVMKESRQAPNTLLLLGVLVIDRYMGHSLKNR